MGYRVTRLSIVMCLWRSLQRRAWDSSVSEATFCQLDDPSLVSVAYTEERESQFLNIALWPPHIYKAFLKIKSRVSDHLRWISATQLQATQVRTGKTLTCPLNPPTSWVQSLNWHTYMSCSPHPHCQASSYADRYLLCRVRPCQSASRKSRDALLDQRPC